MKALAGKGLERFGALFFAVLRSVAAITGASFGGAVKILFLVVGVLEVPMFLAGPVPLALYNGIIALMFLGARRVGAACKKAIEARDFPEALRLRRIIDGKGEPKSASMRSLKKVGDGELLLDFEKWSEAAETFAAIDLDMLPEISRPGIVSELGYARAHAGDTKRGLADINRAFELADAQPKFPEHKRFHLARRRGIALSLAGKHRKAVEDLAPLRADFQGTMREFSETFYFLGRSHASLGQKDEAGAALAASVVGEGPFVGRAWKTLGEIFSAEELDELRAEIAKHREPKN